MSPKMRAIAHLKGAQESLNLAARACCEIPEQPAVDHTRLADRYDRLNAEHERLLRKYEALLAYCKGHSNRLVNEIIKAETE